MNIILHISNTDIATDSRIRKEMYSLIQTSQNFIIAIGLADDRTVGCDALDGILYYKLRSISKLFNFLPRFIRYFFELLEFTFRVVSQVRQLNDKITIVHCHDTFALPAGWFIKMLYGSKLIYDAHELESNKNGQNFILSKVTYFIEKICWKKIDLFISVSNSIIDWYIDNFGYKKNLLILNSPVFDFSKINIENKLKDNYFASKYALSNEACIFVYLGILGSGRGIEVILDVFQKLKSENAHIVFIGYGVLEDLIKEISQTCDKVHYHEPVKHTDVVSLVSKADYGLCFVENASLSDYLCLPNKLFEYSFAGLKVLASNFPEIEKIVKEYGLGICCSPDSNSITNAVKDALNKPEWHINRKDISELEWNKQAIRLIEAYSSIHSQ